MGEDSEHRQRIKLWMAGCLVVTAFSIDLFELLLEWLGIGLIINFTTTPAVTLLFWIWFKLLDVPFLASPKRFFTMFATSFGELIPGLDALGGFLWTLGTIIIILMVRAEDKGGMLGQLSTAAMGIMKESRRTGQFHRVSRDELAAVASGRGEEYYKNKQALAGVKPFDKNQNTLNLKDKNTQAEKSSMNNQQQKQEATNQSAKSQQEINKLQADINRYQSELQQAKSELAQKEQYYKQNEEGFTRGLEVIRSSRELSKEEEAKYFRDHDTRMTSFYQDINRIKSKIGGLERLIPQLQNEIAGLQSKSKAAA